MIDKVKVAKLLRLLVEIVEDASEEDLRRLGELPLSDLFSELESKRRRGRSRTKSTNDVDEFGVISGLNDVATRAEGLSFLRGQSLNKRQLEKIARHLDLPLLREDSVKRLMEKIVEITVGPRINSQAIRGR